MNTKQNNSIAFKDMPVSRQFLVFVSCNGRVLWGNYVERFTPKVAAATAIYFAHGEFPDIPKSEMTAEIVEG